MFLYKCVLFLRLFRWIKNKGIKENKTISTYIFSSLRPFPASSTDKRDEYLHEGPETQYQMDSTQWSASKIIVTPGKLCIKLYHAFAGGLC